MKQKIILILALIGFTGPTYAYSETYINPWTVDVAFGMTSISDAANKDGQSAVGRLSFGHTLLTKPYWQMGIETGIQSGNTMRLLLPKESIDALGGVLLHAEIKPFLDVLIGVKTQPIVILPFVGWIKGGVAYRKLQVDRMEVNDLESIAPEMQLGFGYRINVQTTVTLGYQAIWGMKPELTVNPEREVGLLRYIPGQQAVMIGFSFDFL
jgi:hypothetical protein